jgi:hypothetical protein
MKIKRQRNRGREREREGEIDRCTSTKRAKGKIQKGM